MINKQKDKKPNITRFDKLFIIDINPSNDDITNELVVGKLSRVIKNAALYQNVVIVGHANLTILKQMTKDINIKNAFIISDNGSRIYNIKDNTVIWEAPMFRESVLATIHCGLMQDNLVLASGVFKEYAYSANLVNAISLNQKHYIPLAYTNDYNKFLKFLESSPIYSVMIYQANRLLLQKSISDFGIVAKDWNVVAEPGTLINRLGHYFSINSRESTKYKAILKLMEVTKISNFEKVYYYALNTVNKQCINAFKHHLMHQYLALKTDYYDQIDIQASADQIVRNMTHAFFEGNNIDSDKFENRGIVDTKRLIETMGK